MTVYNDKWILTDKNNLPEELEEVLACTGNRILYLTIDSRTNNNKDWFLANIIFWRRIGSSGVKKEDIDNFNSSYNPFAKRKRN